MSCHNFFFTVWAHDEALRRGVAVDAGKLQEWIGRSRESYLAKREWFKLTGAALQQLAGESVPASVRNKLLPAQGQAIRCGG